MKVYCIIITYNGSQWLDKCLSSLRTADYPIKTIIVDNGSSDGTQDLITYEFPEVELIQSEVNLGFGKANNIGIKKAINEGADYILLLNQDAYFLSGSLMELLRIFESNPSAGIISPIHLAGDERNLDAAFLNYVKPSNTPNFLGDLVRGQLQKLYKSNFINAAAWFIRAELIKKIGVFHPIFDHYGEDNEYINRVKKNRFELLVYSKMLIVHDRPQSKVEKKDTKKFCNRIKQRMLVGYCTGELTKRRIDQKYIKTITLNLLLLNLNFARTSLKSWIDLQKKIKKIDSFDYSLDAK